MKHTFFLLLILLFISNTAFAATDEGLYNPVAPEGSAFFRFINADPASSDLVPQADTKKYGPVHFKSVTPYYTIKANHVNFSIGEKQIRKSLAEKKFYSIVLTQNGISVFEDKSLALSAKALLGLYNFTDEEKISLKLADRPIQIIDPVAPGRGGFREINPVKINMSLFDKNNKQIAKLDPVPLERGAVYSLVAFKNSDKKIEVETIRVKIDTTK